MAVLGSLALGPTWTAVAQTWSPAQREVLQSLENCNRAAQTKNLEAELACYHEDFLGWAIDMPALRDKAWQRAQAPLEYAANDIVAWSVQPLAVLIHGNVAVVHYYQYVLSRDKAGKDTPARVRWTDVLLKQGNRWVWIADHGGTDPGTKPVGGQ
jgi:ketosteroid isomerase-like protein